jgi:hypothetical protein
MLYTRPNELLRFVVEINGPRWQTDLLVELRIILCPSRQINGTERHYLEGCIKQDGKTKEETQSLSNSQVS